MGGAWGLARVAVATTATVATLGLGDRLDEGRSDGLLTISSTAASVPGIAADGTPWRVSRRIAFHRAPPVVPAAPAIAEARRFAADRAGLVSFAVVDSRGRHHGLGGDRGYVTASVVKAMLLAAELRRLAREGLELDATTDAALRAMITYSDNGAADTIYSRVGDVGLLEVARSAGMTRFSVEGYWGNAQITATDMTRLFADLDRALPPRFREFGLGLLGSVIPEQSWGIPAGAGERWAVRFKGGWRSTALGQLVHQVAELRDGGRTVAIAVLTDGQPTQAYGIETVRGIAARLVGPEAERDRHPARGRPRWPRRGRRATLRAPRWRSRGPGSPGRSSRTG
jgi:beta-lactamase class A